MTLTLRLNPEVAAARKAAKAANPCPPITVALQTPSTAPVPPTQPFPATPLNH